MEQFRSVVSFQRGDLEQEYEKLNAALKESESEADVDKLVHDMDAAIAQADRFIADLQVEQ